MKRSLILASLSLSMFALAAGCGDGSGGSGGGGGSTGGTGTGTGGATSSGGSTSSGGATSSGGTSTGGSTGGTASTGDCATDNDCSGTTCVEVNPGGYKVCTVNIAEATDCSQLGMPTDECCNSADCAMGKCYLSTNIPYCGGPAMAEYNRCVTDACATDSDCGPNAVCAPAGVFGNPMRSCVVAYCKSNADCGGGTCAPIANSCCGVPAGMACVHAGGCRNDKDCSANGTQHCEIDPATKSGVCKDGPMPCPA